MVQQIAPGSDCNPVVVLGMHRSGTSLTTHLIHHMGFHVSTNRWADQFNQKGYWEDRDVVDTNALILHALGGDWKHLYAPNPCPSRVTQISLGLLDRKISATMRGYPPDMQWVLKDPRLSVTLPFWQPYLANARYVLCVRNPLAVARSLERRDRIPIRDGLRLWYQYTWLALKNTREWPTLVLHYEKYFGKAAQTQTEKLGRFLGMDCAVSTTALADEVLNHHHMVPDTVLKNHGVAVPIRALYAALLEESSVREVLKKAPWAPDLPTKTVATTADQVDLVRDWLRRLYHRYQRITASNV